MSEAQNLKKLGVVGGIAAALGAFAHGADDCARAGVRASAGAGDDITRIAPVGASDDVARIAPVVQRRSSALPAVDDALSTPSSRRAFGEELASHTLDAADLLLEISSDDDQVESWGPIGAPTYIALHHTSSRADFANQLGAASVGPPVFVIGQASATAADAISISNSAIAVGEIQSDCLSHGVSCVVLICGPEAGCVARAHALSRTAVIRGSRRLDRVLGELLQARAAQRWYGLVIYRLADTPEGPRIVRSRAGRME
jgi:hypothetical protein